MTVMDNEDPADPSVHEPRVTGSPEAIWLVYGELAHDDTHAELCSHEGVTWCEDAQFAADVRYTRTDLVAERVLAAVAAERERWKRAAEEMAQEADHKFTMDGTVAHWLRALVAKRGRHDCRQQRRKGGAPSAGDPEAP